MSALRESAADTLAAALSSIASSHDVPITTSPASGTCLHTSVGDLCCLVVPNRSEVQIALTSTWSGWTMDYPLGVIQAAIGRESRAILYRRDSFDAVLPIVTSLIIDFLAEAQANPDGLSEKIRTEYDDMLTQSRLEEIRHRVKSLWDSGRYNEAVAAYQELPELSPLERQRIALIASGKMPRPKSS
jgi:hypothetical protein